MNDHTTPIKQTTERTVMATIEQGSIKMRSRWFFAMQTGVVCAVLFIIIGVVVYVVSLAVFITEETGVWVAPQYGWQGVILFTRSIPWFLILSVFVLLAVVEILARRFSFIYSRPLAYSFVLSVVCVAAAGSFVAQTSLHHTIVSFARRHHVPFVPQWYDNHTLDMQRGMWRGRVVTIDQHGFVIEHRSGRTTTIMISTETRIPPAPIRLNDRVMVVGNGETSTVSAWGVRLAPPLPR